MEALSEVPRTGGMNVRCSILPYPHWAYYNAYATASLHSTGST
ncbi:hypothetical protein [Paenibacillus sp. S150]|nr:hypothetical protein [Paenibacillus sp. S150]